MGFTEKELGAIQLCYEEHGWRGAQICRFFPKKGWNPWNVNRAINRLEEAGSINRQKGTGLKKSVMNEDMEA